jgi:hypothetical protein
MPGSGGLPISSFNGQPFLEQDYFKRFVGHR